MAVDNWGPETAVACVRFWMRSKYPNIVFAVQIHRNPYTFNYHTQIRIASKNGTPMAVEFETFDTDFNTNTFSMPEETQAQLMLLLG